MKCQGVRAGVTVVAPDETHLSRMGQSVEPRGTEAFQDRPRKISGGLRAGRDWEH